MRLHFPSTSNECPITLTNAIETYLYNLFLHFSGIDVKRLWEIKERSAPESSVLRAYDSGLEPIVPTYCSIVLSYC